MLGVIASQPLLAQDKANTAATESTAAASTAPAATTPTTATAQAAPSEADLAWAAAEKVMTRGPAQVAVEQQATLDLPEGYLYVPKLEAQQLLEAWGNGQDSSVEGLVFPTQGDLQNWFLVVSWEKTGFIKDDDAKTWDPADLGALIFGDGWGGVEVRASNDRPAHQWPGLRPLGTQAHRSPP